jgi:hypothetical protein
MGILDEIMNEKRRKSRECQILAVMKSMDKAEAAELETALGDFMIQTSAITRVLNRKGHSISQSSIARHRRMDCTCE